MRGARRDVLGRVSGAGDLRAGADLDVADGAGLAAHDDEIAKLGRAGDAALRHDARNGAR